MPKQIQRPEFGSRLVRLFNLKGRYQPVLDETIVPVVDVGSEKTTEFQACAGTIENQLLQTGGSTRQYHALNNPSSSGIICIVDSVRFGQAGPTDGLFWDVFLGSTFDGLLPEKAGEKAFLDGLRRDVFSTYVPTTELKAWDIGAGVIQRVRIGRLDVQPVVAPSTSSAGMDIFWGTEIKGVITLAPGQSFSVLNSGPPSANTTITTEWQWREIALVEQRVGVK